jgi:glutamate-1-semialdehyde 2,1-aminomutase
VSAIDQQTRRSYDLHRKALAHLPMGVTGDGRYSEPYPIMFERAQGKVLHDVDGNAYLDYHGGFGTAILGVSPCAAAAAPTRSTTACGWPARRRGGT